MKFSLTNLVDPLGLPVSPEALWEQAENTVRTIGEAVKETAQQTFGLDMRGNFKDFQEGRGKTPDTVKTPELLKEEQNEASELNRKREFFAKLTADLQNIQFAEPKAEIDELTVQAATMGTEERNELLGHQVGLRREHTSNAYSIANIRSSLMDLNNKQEEKVVNIPIPSPAKQANALETQFEGAKGQLGSGTASLSSASGAAVG